MNYGFHRANTLPDSYVKQVVIEPSNVEWAITGSYHDSAKNHCASILVMNLMRFFQGKIIEKNSDEVQENTLRNRPRAPFNGTDHREVFNRVHAHVGNGPNAFVASKALKLYRDFFHKNLNKRIITTQREFEEAMNSSQPVAFLVAASPIHWHWILCVGYRDYVDNNQKTIRYYRIVNGWNNEIQFYKKNERAMLWSMTKYWM